MSAFSPRVLPETWPLTSGFIAFAFSIICFPSGVVFEIRSSIAASFGSLGGALVGPPFDASPLLQPTISRTARSGIALFIVSSSSPADACHQSDGSARAGKHYSEIANIVAGGTCEDQAPCLLQERMRIVALNKG